MPQNLFNKYKNHIEEVHVLAKDHCSQEFIELSVCRSVCDEESFILDGYDFGRCSISFIFCSNIRYEMAPNPFSAKDLLLYASWHK